MRPMDLHFLLGGTHGAVQQFLEARNPFQRLTSVGEHVPGAGGISRVSRDVRWPLGRDGIKLPQHPKRQGCGLHLARQALRC